MHNHSTERFRFIKRSQAGPHKYLKCFCRSSSWSLCWQISIRRPTRRTAEAFLRTNQPLGWLSVKNESARSNDFAFLQMGCLWLTLKIILSFGIYKYIFLFPLALQIIEGQGLPSRMLVSLPLIHRDLNDHTANLRMACGEHIASPRLLLAF